MAEQLQMLHTTAIGRDKCLCEFSKVTHENSELNEIIEQLTENNLCTLNPNGKCLGIGDVGKGQVLNIFLLNEEKILLLKAKGKWKMKKMWLCLILLLSRHLFPTGSPLVSNSEVIGIASRIMGCGVPDVYTKIYPYLKWIQTEMDRIIYSFNWKIRKMYWNFPKRSKK